MRKKDRISKKETQNKQERNTEDIRKKHRINERGENGTSI